MSRIVGVVVGGIFIVVQTLAYYGYVVVDNEKLKKDVEVIIFFT